MLAHSFSGKLYSAYDSHVHWRGTGSIRRLHDLTALSSKKDLSELAQSSRHQSGWILGSGWDQHKFSNPNELNRKALDESFPKHPVYFRRIDAHTAWVNTLALQKAGLWMQNIQSPYGGKIELDKDGWPTGILVDNAMESIRRILPTDNIATVKEDLLVGQSVFHKAGFTHVRDMTCDEIQWQAACELAEEKKLKLAAEIFFGTQNTSDFDKMLSLSKRAKKEHLVQGRLSNLSLNLLRPQGVKIFFDGALGSEGAWISREYASGSGKGLQLIEVPVLKEMMASCFESDLIISIHAIGDEAIHQIASAAMDLKVKGSTGEIHIEHAQVIRDETLKLLKQLNVTCFLQPSHWLSDKTWLNEKLGDLARDCFRWSALEALEIPFYFGSDCPIEITSLEKTLLALQSSSQQGVAPLKDPWQVRHQHPDKNWCGDSFTVFKKSKPVQVVFCGQAIC